MPRSYDDIDDKELRGCLRPVVGVVLVSVLILVALCLASCRSCPCPPDMAQIYDVLSAP